MMKILLIQSYLLRKSNTIFPLGLACLASCLKTHDVRILDLNLYEDPYAELQTQLAEFVPDVVGISLRNIDNQTRISLCYFYKEYQATIGKIKELAPLTPLVTGGAGYSMFAREIMERNPELDFGIYQEGEESFSELLDNMDDPQKVQGVFFRKNGKVVFSGHRKMPDITSLPVPRRDFAEISKYSISKFAFGIQTKRGCSLNCTYCNYPLLSGRKVRLRRPENVVDEIEELIDKYQINSFIFTDSVFNVPVHHAGKICEEIIRRKIKVRWAAYFDIRFADKDFLLLARCSGCQDFVFSPDAVSEGALKGLNKGICKTDIDRTIALFRTQKTLKTAHAKFNFFVNGPGETFFGFLLTLFFYLQTKFLLRGRGGSGIAWIRIEPDTDLYNIAVDNGILKSETDLLPDAENGLKDLFFSQPPLHHLDSFVIVLLKITVGAKKIVKKIIKIR